MSLPVIELADLVDFSSEATVRFGAKADRHGWSLGTGEQLVLQVLIGARACHTAFEIGTFNGGTTRLIAETLPDDGRVWTIDLPPAEFDSTQAPDDFSGLQVGAAYAARSRLARRSPRSSAIRSNTILAPTQELRTSCLWTADTSMRTGSPTLKRHYVSCDPAG